MISNIKTKARTKRVFGDTLNTNDPFQQDGKSHALPIEFLWSDFFFKISPPKRIVLDLHLLLLFISTIF